MVTFTVKTNRRREMLDITAEVKKAVAQNGVSAGAAIIFVPHTTAGITINENADPDVVRDLLSHLEKLVPGAASYRHSEGNADAHIQASLLGSSVMVIIEEGRLRLGTWQGIFFCEFDGPRTRQVYVQLIPAKK